MAEVSATLGGTSFVSPGGGTSLGIGFLATAPAGIGFKANGAHSWMVFWPGSGLSGSLFFFDGDGALFFFLGGMVTSFSWAVVDVSDGISDGPYASRRTSSCVGPGGVRRILPESSESDKLSHSSKYVMDRRQKLRNINN